FRFGAGCKSVPDAWRERHDRRLIEMVHANFTHYAYRSKELRDVAVPTKRAVLAQLVQERVIVRRNRGLSRGHPHTCQEDTKPENEPTQWSTSHKTPFANSQRGAGNPKRRTGQRKPRHEECGEHDFPD